MSKKKKAVKRAHWTSYLVQLGCDDVEQYRKYATVQEAWAACTDLDLISYLVDRFGGYALDCRKLIAGCAKCAGDDSDFNDIYPFEDLTQDTENDGHLRVFQGRKYTNKQWIAFVKTAFPVPDLWALKEACAGRIAWVPA